LAPSQVEVKNAPRKKKEHTVRQHVRKQAKSQEDDEENSAETGWLDKDTNDIGPGSSSSIRFGSNKSSLRNTPASLKANPGMKHRRNLGPTAENYEKAASSRPHHHEDESSMYSNGVYGSSMNGGMKMSMKAMKRKGWKDIGGAESHGIF
jgi:hypothetical protein